MGRPSCAHLVARQPGADGRRRGPREDPPPNGHFGTFRVARASDIPYGIALGPDGNLWFAQESSHPAIGRITPAGRITEFADGLNRGSLPFEITVGPDGAMWFTDQGSTPAIGRITMDGRITEFWWPEQG